MKIDGRCHCGFITYAAEIDPEKVTICHCTDCQTLSGSAFRTVAPTLVDGFTLLSGEPKIYLKTAESGAERALAFCPRCGTQLYGTSTGDGPKRHSLRVGAILQRDMLTPKRQIWCRSEQPWINSLSTIPKKQVAANVGDMLRRITAEYPQLATLAAE